MACSLLRSICLLWRYKLRLILYTSFAKFSGGRAFSRFLAADTISGKLMKRAAQAAEYGFLDIISGHPGQVV